MKVFPHSLTHSPSRLIDARQRNIQRNKKNVMGNQAFMASAIRNFFIDSFPEIWEYGKKQSRHSMAPSNEIVCRRINWELLNWLFCLPATHLF